MAKEIVIEVNDIEARAELYDNEMAENIWEELPLSGQVRTWGEEIYFPITIEEGEGETKAEVEIGELGYWNQGNAFCVFFGPTPSSTGEKPRPASPVTVFGRLVDDPNEFKQISVNDDIRVRKNQENS